MFGYDMMLMKKRMKRKKADVLIIAFFVTISVILLLFRFFFSDPGKEAVVSIDGNVVDRFLLSEDITKDYQVDHCENSVQIKDGKVSVSHANCPDKICVSQGEISNVGESIVCLPHKFVITIEGKSKRLVDGMVQ